MFLQIQNEVQKFSSPSQRTLLAVSKLQANEKIEFLYSLGQRDFAENYVQEAIEKMSFFQNHKDIRWHFIGSIQKNKVKFFKNNFYLIHSIDSLGLAEVLSKKCCEINHVQNILLQVNLAAEQTKSGFLKEELEKFWPALQKLPGLKIHGLMTMPPLQNMAEENRKYFRQLKELSLELKKLTDASVHPMNQLSMGTSSDYLVALEEGATIVRLGTILFGERPKK